MARDNQGKPYSVRYEAVNAMLLNEFLKEHRKVEEQGAEMNTQRRTIEQLQSTVAMLQSALARQAGQLQQVSDRLEAHWSAPPVADNH